MQTKKRLIIVIAVVISLIFIPILIFTLKDTNKHSGYSKADIEAATEVIYDYYENNENKNIRLVNITYKPDSVQNRKFDGLFFTVDLDVTYTENGGDGFEEGLNKNWGIWLSKDKDSGKWIITDQGH